MSVFDEYFVDLIKNKYVDFEGRARRSEYWYFTLFYYLGIFAISSVGSIFISISENLSVAIICIYVVGLFLPALAVKVRRLHDTGNSGWMLLIKMIPFIGSIVIFVFLITDSKPETNQWGPNPKAPNITNEAADHLLEDEIV